MKVIYVFLDYTVTLEEKYIEKETVLSPVWKQTFDILVSFSLLLSYGQNIRPRSFFLLQILKTIALS